MSTSVKIFRMLPRKITSASIAATIYSIILGLVQPNPFGAQMDSFSDYMWEFTVTMSVYLLFIFPIMLTYGVITSIISDLAAEYYAFKFKYKKSSLISALLHIIFGLILLWVSVFAALIFYFMDRYLSLKSSFSWTTALKSMAVPVLLWLGFMSVIWIRG